MPRLIHQSIEASAERQPEAPAFSFRDASLTYEALAEGIFRFARVLHRLGLDPMERIGIYAPKSLQSPVAVHGILRAGAAYVPIDPSLPPERVAFILRDCGIRHLVTDPSKRPQLEAVMASGVPLQTLLGIPPGTSAQLGDVTCLSWEMIAAESPLPPDVAIPEHALAYIMYTSGSTGVPKGLMHTHASGMAYAELAARTYELTPADRLGNHSPLHFDMSTFEFFAAPLAGATTIIVPDETKLFPVALAQLIEKEALSVWYSVPVALVQMLTRGEMEKRDWSRLRWVIFAGEVFPPKHLRKLMQRLPGARFSNAYGPAETNVCTVHHVEAAGQPEENRPLPIGRPWAHTDVLVVGSDDEPVQPGTPGELLVHSSTLMQGYWGRPELNAEAFFDRPIGKGFHLRYYRTGDLVRQEEDGLLTFLGRKDRQIKIRGYRVELDEIEIVLGSHPDVFAAAVAADERDPEAVRLVAFLRWHENNPSANAEAVRAFARERLPPYAVPEIFRVQPTFPQTGSGKIDRNALLRTLSN